MTPSPPCPRTAVFNALAAVGLWSTVATAFKLSLRTLSVTSLLLYASLVSMAALGSILIATGQWRLIKRQRARDWTFSALTGLLNPFLYYLILFKAYDLLPAQQAQPLNYTWPLVLALMSSAILHKRPRGMTLIALVVCFTGVVVISTGGDPLAHTFTSPLGAGLALGSSLLWAIYWLLNMRDPREPVLKLFMGFVMGSVYIVVFAAWRGELAAPSLAGFIGAAYVGLFEMGVTFVLWLNALRLARDPAAISALAYLSPFLSLALISTIAGESILPSSIVGLALIVAGIALNAWRGREEGGERT